MDQHFDIKNRKIWKPFLINLCLVILVFSTGVFIGLFARQKQFLEEQMLIRAQAHFNSIIVFRQWNALHNGVYVEKKKAVTSNPYLTNPDITTVDGRVFTKKNPALMTREVAELTAQRHDCSFRITSLKPLNPTNRPDAFEEEALRAFADGANERYTKVREGDITFFRYMAPLATEKSCLPCHASQGYREGDIRGGISIKFDVSTMEIELKRNLFVLALLGMATLAILFITIYAMVLRLIVKLRQAIHTIHLMATTDELTKLFNRRHFFGRFNDETRLSIRHGHWLSLIMLDLDHFKRINDEYGHQVGDTVLKETAILLKEVCRATDILARYGGEEFIVLLPQTDREGALALAEKLRQRIVAHDIWVDESTTLRLTASLGLVTMNGDQLKAMANCDKMIQLADLALYRAKGNGRNRVECFDADRPANGRNDDN